LWEESEENPASTNISYIIDKQYGLTLCSDRRTISEKATELLAIFPHAGLEDIKIHLNIDQNMQEARKTVEVEFGLPNSIEVIQYTKKLEEPKFTSSDTTSVTRSSRKRKSDDVVSFPTKMRILGEAQKTDHGIGQAKKEEEIFRLNTSSFI
jgi:hypothetical protein